jgi:hypothetical protein
MATQCSKRVSLFPSFLELHADTSIRLPAFKPLTQERAASIGETVSQSGSFTQLPTDILRLVLAKLDTRSFAKVGATCRSLRKEGLTAFQEDARRRVLLLDWATPLPDEIISGYKSAVFIATKDATAYRVADQSTGNPAQPGMDWLFYLSHMHRTTAMRARRRIHKRAELIRTTRDRAREIMPLWTHAARPYGTLLKSDARMVLEIQARFLHTPDISRKGGMENVQKMMTNAQNAPRGGQ